MKFNLPSIFGIAVIALMLGGCGSSLQTYHLDPEDKTVSFIYGYVNSGAVEKVFVKKVDEPTSFYGCAYKKLPEEKGTVFYHMGIQPGKYQVNYLWLGPMGFSSGGEADLSSLADKLPVIDIPKPGPYYMGSYTYKGPRIIVVGRGLLSSFDPADTPTEDMVVERVMKIMEDKGDDKHYPRQYGWLKQRLAQLKHKPSSKHAAAG